MSYQNIETAYWREIEKQKCDFNFNLNYKNEKFEINKDVHALRNVTDTIESMLKHIKSKIEFFIKKECETLSINYEEKYKNLEMNMTLKLNKKDLEIDEKCKIILDNNKELTFTIFNQVFNVQLNAPLVLSFQLPQVIYSETEIYACKFKALYLDKNRSDFLWYRSKDKKEWQIVDSGWTHKTSKKDLNCFLKLTCKSKNLLIDGPEFETISKHPVVEFPEMPTCPFEDRHLYTENHLSGNKFRIMTYNVLSDRYCREDAFEYCPIQYMSIDYRKELIIKELLGYHADIICLQEMDEFVFKNFYSNHLKKAGYNCIFNKKGNRIPEGLCVAFRKSKFVTIKQIHIVLCEQLLKNPLMKKIRNCVKRNEDVFDTFCQQGTSLQLTVLKCVSGGKILLIANTHLYYHPDCDHIRLLQLQISLRYIENFIENIKKQNNNANVILLFCGDFNSNPQRTAYNLLMDGEVTSGEVIEKIWKNYKIYQPYKFKSAYGTPKFTNYTATFKGCLDYIFYEQNKLALLQTVPLPEENIVAANTALPSQYFPSDHVALVADFEIL